MNDQRPNNESERTGDPEPFVDDDGEEATAELVAFLDGELEPRETEAVEAKISLDANVRAKANALKKTWDLLDHLPRTEPSPNFTERTISRIEPVRMSAQTDSKNGPTRDKSGSSPTRISASSSPTFAAPTRRSIGRRVAVVACWLFAFALAGFAGYTARDRMVERVHRMDEQEKDAKILAEGRLLRSLHNYHHIDDLAFLKELDSPDLFGEDHPASEATP